MVPTLAVWFRRLLPLLFLSALVAAAHAQSGYVVPDDGVYHLYQNGHLLGEERVTFELRRDSTPVRTGRVGTPTSVSSMWWCRRPCRSSAVTFLRTRWV